MNPKLKILLQRPRALLNLTMRGMNPESQLCPSCGGKPLSNVLDRRFGVMVLRRCSCCLLLFRTPTDTHRASIDFYQSNYTEESVTELSNPLELENLKSSGFATKGGLAPYIALMSRFYQDSQAKLLDYGCSWGYNTWRFTQAGFQATGVEVSQPRCDFGRKHLAVDAHYSVAGLPSDFDIFFSSHVFEHVPSPRASYDEAKRLLGEKGGLFIVITPNGSEAFRKARPSRWHELWGRKHPNFLDDQFWQNLLGVTPHAVMSRNEDGSVTAPLDSINPESLGKLSDFDISGEELIVVARISKSEQGQA